MASHRWGLSVRRVPTEVSAVDRAQWLAELAEALEQAQRLAWQLGADDGGNAEAMELYGRLEAARLEVQSLRMGQFSVFRRNPGPKWTELLRWPEEHGR